MSGEAHRRAALPAWINDAGVARNDDLTQRVIVASEAPWLTTSVAGLEMLVLEHITTGIPRLSARLRLAEGVDATSLGQGADLEIHVESGCVQAGDMVWPAGHYIRLPLTGDARVDNLILRHDDHSTDTGPPSIYVATGHIAPSDTERRVIDTEDVERWLPGPVQGTEVMPLHGHGRGNVMLIRWLDAVEFQPRLDPLGEEVLVLRGCLHDSHGNYPAGSWIRNPVPAWQSWAADPGTRVYYKNGHFAIDSDSQRPVQQ